MGVEIELPPYLQKQARCSQVGAAEASRLRFGAMCLFLAMESELDRRRHNLRIPTGTLFANISALGSTGIPALRGLAIVLPS